jgi:hypothetical protein
MLNYLNGELKMYLPTLEIAVKTEAQIEHLKFFALKAGYSKNCFKTIRNYIAGSGTLTTFIIYGRAFGLDGYEYEPEVLKFDFENGLKNLKDLVKYK